VKKRSEEPRSMRKSGGGKDECTREIDRLVLRELTGGLAIRADSLPRPGTPGLTCVRGH